MEERGEAESTDAPGRVTAKELDEADNLKYYSVCVCVKWWQGHTVLFTIMVLTGSTGVGGRRHWRVLRVISSTRLSAYLLNMEKSGRKVNYSGSATPRDGL